MSYVCPKIAYPNRGAAAKALKSLLTKHSHHGLQIYRCEHCGAWHLGRDRTTEIRLRRRA